MARKTREQDSDEQKRLLGQFIFWAGQLDEKQTPYLIGPQHIPAIKAAAETLFAQMSRAGRQSKKAKAKT